MMVFPHVITCEHRDTLHCTRQWVVLLGKREAQEACAANVRNIVSALVQNAQVHSQGGHSGWML